MPNHKAKLKVLETIFRFDYPMLFLPRPLKNIARNRNTHASAKGTVVQVEIFPFCHSDFVLRQLVVVPRQMKQSVNHYSGEFSLEGDPGAGGIFTHAVVTDEDVSVYVLTIVRECNDVGIVIVIEKFYIDFSKVFIRTKNIVYFRYTALLRFSSL